MRATPGKKPAQRISMFAIAMLLASESYSQSTDDSDFAGVTLNASERAVDLRNGSRIYFSVSDINSPTYNGNVMPFGRKRPSPMV